MDEDRTVIILPFRSSEAKKIGNFCNSNTYEYMLQNYKDFPVRRPGLYLANIKFYVSYLTNDFFLYTFRFLLLFLRYFDNDEEMYN